MHFLNSIEHAIPESTHFVCHRILSKVQGVINSSKFQLSKIQQTAWENPNIINVTMLSFCCSCFPDFLIQMCSFQRMQLLLNCEVFCREVFLLMCPPSLGETRQMNVMLQGIMFQGVYCVKGSGLRGDLETFLFILFIT